MRTPIISTTELLPLAIKGRELLTGLWYEQEMTEMLKALEYDATAELLLPSVASALSPQLRWDRNKQAAVFLLSEYLQPGPRRLTPTRLASIAKTFGILPASVDRAAELLRYHQRVPDATPLDLAFKLAGPKTHWFARALAGNREAVVLDVWMARILGLDKKRLSYWPYYTSAAEQFITWTKEHSRTLGSSSPRDVQAWVWEAAAKDPQIVQPLVD